MGKLIDRKVTTVYVLRDDKGNSIITPAQQLQIDNFRGGAVTEDCPACDGDGCCGGDYCDVCWGKGKFTYTKELNIVPLPPKEYRQTMLRELTGKELKQFLKDNPGPETQIVFTGKEWDKIPQDIKAITVCSRGTVNFYSGVSGIYRRYDDEHTRDKRHKGGQRWYFGSSLPGLDITDKHKDLDILVHGGRSFDERIFYRPGEKPAVLDFEKPFDFRYFPDAVTRLFVTFGGMNVAEHTIDVVAGSNCMYLRQDNVVWGYGGRNHIDKEFNINLCADYINDKTGAYPVRKSYPTTRDCNEMNLELRNIPYTTVVLVLPADRSRPVVPNTLKRDTVAICNKINTRVRPIDTRFTIAKYPFKYSDARQKAEQWLLEHVVSGEHFSYSIEGDRIDIDGSVCFSGKRADVRKVPYRFNEVTGTFTILGHSNASRKDIVKSIDDLLPSKCGKLVLTHFRDLKDVSVLNTKVTSGVLRLQFMDGLRTFGKQHKSIKTLDYYQVNVEKVDFDEDTARMTVKHGERDGDR